MNKYRLFRLVGSLPRDSIGLVDAHLALLGIGDHPPLAGVVVVNMTNDFGCVTGNLNHDWSLLHFRWTYTDKLYSNYCIIYFAIIGRVSIAAKPN